MLQSTGTARQPEYLEQDATEYWDEVFYSKIISERTVHNIGHLKTIGQTKKHHKEKKKKISETNPQLIKCYADQIRTKSPEFN